MFHATDWPASPRDSRYPIRCRTDSPPICVQIVIYFSVHGYTIIYYWFRAICRRDNNKMRNDLPFSLILCLVPCALPIWFLRSSANNDGTSSQMKWNLWIELINYYSWHGSRSNFECLFFFFSSGIWINVFQQPNTILAKKAHSWRWHQLVSCIILAKGGFVSRCFEISHPFIGHWQT